MFPIRVSEKRRKDRTATIIGHFEVQFDRSQPIAAYQSQLSHSETHLAFLLLSMIVKSKVIKRCLSTVGYFPPVPTLVFFVLLCRVVALVDFFFYLVRSPIDHDVSLYANHLDSCWIA